MLLLCLDEVENKSVGQYRHLIKEIIILIDAIYVITFLLLNFYVKNLDCIAIHGKCIN